ncbi:MAG: hypothetical protein WCQ82_06665 [Bacteroidaceae bacterium]|nr:hypothetical protein [Bacteroidaceae bacterium]
MDLQEIIVIIIGLGCISYVVLLIWRFFKRTNQNENMCSHCDADCKLRNIAEQRLQKEEQTRNKEKSEVIHSCSSHLPKEATDSTTKKCH